VSEGGEVPDVSDSVAVVVDSVWLEL